MGHYQEAYDFDAEKARKAKSGTKKIADLPQEDTCKHREHNPPTMMVWEPGIYEHTCPGCGHVQRFTIGPKPSL